MFMPSPASLVLIAGFPALRKELILWLLGGRQGSRLLFLVSLSGHMKWIRRAIPLPMLLKRFGRYVSRCRSLSLRREAGGPLRLKGSKNLISSRLLGGRPSSRMYRLDNTGIVHTVSVPYFFYLALQWRPFWCFCSLVRSVMGVLSVVCRNGFL